MRLHEINHDKEEIHELLLNSFEIADDVKYIIKSNGLVNVSGNITLDVGVSELPVKFGIVSGSFKCSMNLLTTLNGSPTFIGYHFACQANKLTSLQGCTQKIGGNFRCHSNELTSLVGGPRHVGGNYLAAFNPLTSLDGLPESLGGHITISYDKNLPLINLMFVKGLTKVMFDPIEGDSVVVQKIINKYLGQGTGAALQCAAELSKLGFKGNAGR